MSANWRRIWWTTTTHSARSPLNKDGERQSLKTSSLLGQAYQWTWFKNTSRKNNPQYLGISSNRGRSSDPHKTISFTLTHIQSRTSPLKPHSQKIPILSFLRQLICPGNFIHIKQEVSQSLQAGVISISSSLTTLTQTPYTLNPSRQDQAWTSRQRTKNFTACWPTEGCNLNFISWTMSVQMFYKNVWGRWTNNSSWYHLTSIGETQRNGQS